MFSAFAIPYQVVALYIVTASILLPLVMLLYKHRSRINIMVGWCCTLVGWWYTLAMWCRSFAAVHGIVKMLIGISKRTGSTGEHVGEVASKSIKTSNT